MRYIPLERTEGTIRWMYVYISKITMNAMSFWLQSCIRLASGQQLLHHEEAEAFQPRGGVSRLLDPESQYHLDSCPVSSRTQ